MPPAQGHGSRYSQAGADATATRTNPASTPTVAVIGDTAAARVLRAYLQLHAPGALEAGARMSGTLGSSATGATGAAPVDLLFDARLSLVEKATGPTPVAACRLQLCWSHSASALSGAVTSADRPVSAGSTTSAAKATASHTVGFSFLPSPAQLAMAEQGALHGSSGGGATQDQTFPPLTLELLEPVTGAKAAVRQAQELLARLGIGTVTPPDQAGGNAFRIFALLLNEAVSAVAERLASAAHIDQAMRLGVNYPAGPLEWAERMGLTDMLDALTGLHAEVGAERFQPQPLLGRLVAAGGERFTDLATFGAAFGDAGDESQATRPQMRTGRGSR